MAAGSTYPKNFARGVILLSDGTGTPVTLVVPMAQGDFTLGPISQHLNEPVIYTARTRILGLGWGAPAQPAISLTALVGNLVGSSNTAPGTVLEFVTGKGAYAANISTQGANRPMTVDVRVTIEGVDFGDTADETIDMEDVQITIEFSEAAEGNTISLSGVVLGALVFTNSTNVVTISAF